MREAIDDAASRIDTELVDQVEVRADLHYTMGDMYLTHLEPGAAYQRALELGRKTYGDDSLNYKKLLEAIEQAE